MSHIRPIAPSAAVRRTPLLANFTPEPAFTSLVDALVVGAVRARSPSEAPTSVARIAFPHRSKKFTAEIAAFPYRRAMQRRWRSKSMFGNDQKNRSGILMLSPG
jgi:hypothetical protein